ncbi:MAG: 3'-5' exoribonuclease [Ignavibacteria bacterium]|jgi:DNA polymerase III epsilon subunit-like protein
MKIFFDTEFTGLHKNTTLISIGLVSEDGNTFYAETHDYDESQCDNWIKTNVINNLILKDYRIAKDYNPYEKNVWVKSANKNLKKSLSHWFEKFTKKYPKVEIWGDCLAYDWVLFNDIFGTAFDIPKNIYYIPFDICTLFKIKGIDPDINREEFINYNVEVFDTYNWGIGNKHNALYDAYIIRQCYNKLQKL